MKDVGILGGGISGLFMGRFLGEGSEVLERDSTPGGLSRTFGGNGFKSDIGGHILFSKDKEALAHSLHVLGKNVRTARRANRILYNGVHVKYPFENGIDQLAPEERVEILCDFIENPHKEKPTQFKEWMFHVFGDALTNKYMLPYNEKIWKTPSEDMSLEWVERVPRPPLRDLVKTAIGISTEGYTHQLYFQYPEKGGFEAFPRAIADGVGQRLFTNCDVQKLKQVDGGWAVITRDGSERRYKQLVSTLPINTLFDALGDVPAEVQAAADALRFNSLRVVLVGIKGETLPEYTALYVPSPEVLAHRLCFNHVFSPDLVPAGHQSISCEITVRPGSDLDQWSDDQLITRKVDDLVKVGLLKKEQVVHTQVHREKYAYVVYDRGYAQRVKVVRDYIEGRGLHIAGRFAEYQYVNTDACVRRALELSKQLRGSIAPESRLPEGALS
ncbi:MAG: FAD-dependent oxidoreductase [Archangium gephyra]|uniref:FAD-dependent oxidoreductase n=1 Tax=Archangium gephyra TaxID=48 RepID=A0A2W5SU11_9BACT|nr:MAG: FAD-dependent oxidoreductase [Archangium gephyra]